jgi:hypothetical protein
LLEGALVEFPYAVTLNVEYAMCIAAAGKLDLATEQIEPLRTMCRIFRDYEALSRLGRIYKDAGDAAWKDDPARPNHAEFHTNRHPGCQFFSLAFDYYHEAFEFSGHYFPGINAAALALLIGDKSEQQRLAEEVAHICRTANLSDVEDRFWIYATEGEAALLMEATTDAVRFYSAALTLPSADRLGMMQPVYNQFCRLEWAMGKNAVRPIRNLLRKRGLLSRLEPGPFS